MFKFLKDITELKANVKEIFEEFNEDRVSDGWFSTRRTLSKRVDDLENIVDKLLGELKLHANEISEKVTPATWEVVKKKATKSSKKK